MNRDQDEGKFIHPKFHSILTYLEIPGFLRLRDALSQFPEDDATFLGKVH